MQIFDRSKGPLPQGDITLIAVESSPTGDVITAERGSIVVAHSETGHHHVVDARNARLERGESPWICYLTVTAEYADLVHLREVNPHETVRLPTGKYKICRQREWTPEGWRAVAD